MKKIESISNTSAKILILFLILFLLTGCNTVLVDKSLKTEAYIVDESKVARNDLLTTMYLSGVYKGIGDMYEDSDYVVSGMVKDIEYFEDNLILWRKINVLVNKSYKGSIKKNTLISILENDGYLRLKSLYEAGKKAYEEKFGSMDKDKEADYMHGVYPLSNIEDAIKNDMLIRLYYMFKVDSKIGDELLLFLTDSSEDTYKDKKVKLVFDSKFGLPITKLSYPKGGYVPLGLGMGKFTRAGGAYVRYIYFFTPEGSNNEIQALRRSYDIKEMEDELNDIRKTSFSPGLRD